MRRRRASAQPAPTPPSHKPNSSRETTSQPASFGAGLARLGADPLRLSSAEVLQLQRTVGNGATARLLARRSETLQALRSDVASPIQRGYSFTMNDDASYEPQPSSEESSSSEDSSSEEGSESEEDGQTSEEAGTPLRTFQYESKHKHVNLFEKGLEYEQNKGENLDARASLDIRIQQQKQATPQLKDASKAEVLRRAFRWSAEDIAKYIDPQDGNKWSEAATPKVEYLGENDRKQYLVQPGAGMSRGQGPFTTKGMSSNGQGAGFGIFVMSPNGEFYSNSHKPGLFHHTSFLEAMPSVGAGEWKIDDAGVLKAINNKSGHYQTGVTQFAQVLQALQGLGVNLKGVEIQMIRGDFTLGPVVNSNKTKSPDKPVYFPDAYSWLDKSGADVELLNELLPGTVTNTAGVDVSVKWFEQGAEFEDAKGERTDSSSFMDAKIRKMKTTPQLDPDKGDDRVKALKLFGWTDDDINKYVKDGKWRPESLPKVEYLNENDREQYQVTPAATMMRGTEPFNTASMTTNKSGAGFGIYVMSPEKAFYSNSHKVGLFHHTSFLEALPTAGAGEWQVDAGGALKVITNKSGHYQTGKAEFVQTLKELQARGVSLAGVDVRLMDHKVDQATATDPDSVDGFLKGLGAKEVK